MKTPQVTQTTQDPSRASLGGWKRKETPLDKPIQTPISTHKPLTQWKQAIYDGVNWLKNVQFSDFKIEI